LIVMAPASDNSRYLAQLHHAVLTAIRDSLRHALERGDSQRGLATKCRISPGTLRKILAAESDVGLGTMIAIASGLGMSSLDEFFGDPAIPSLVRRIDPAVVTA
jgi:hypothetical protein